MGQRTILRSSACHFQGATTNHKAVVMESKMAAKLSQQCLEIVVDNLK